MEVRVQLRGQTRRKETEAGYYSWQEKIMNGHPFCLYSSSLFLSGHTCQIFVGGNSHQNHRGLFFFSLFQRRGGKQKFFDSNRQNIYTWCSRLSRPRQGDTVQSGPKQCFTYSEAERRAQTVSRSQQHTSQEILIGGRGSSGRLWVLNLKRKFFWSVGEQERGSWSRFPRGWELKIHWISAANVVISSGLINLWAYLKLYFKYLKNVQL